MKKAIIVTGTPGTGKTTFAKKLCRKFRLEYLDANKIINQKKLKERYDCKAKTYVVDEKKLALELIKEIKKSKKTLVIDSHLSQFVSPRYVKICFVTKTDIKILNKRLKKRGYDLFKIKENLQSEIFDICLNEALENKHKIIVIETSKRTDFSKIRI